MPERTKGYLPLVLLRNGQKAVHFVQASREMTERIHAYGSKIFLIMSAGFGRVAIPTNLGEFPPVAPSAIPHRWLDKTCRPLTAEEIRSIVKSFGDGAYNAKRAGFDGVETHAVHEGCLLDQFAISMFRLRNDEYGGTLENRLRFSKFGSRRRKHKLLFSEVFASLSTVIA